jgi:hypothetical protein
LSVSYKDSFKIIMLLVAPYNLDLHQMNVKTLFLNGDLYENVYMTQPQSFVVKENENLGCHLIKFIYGIKHASRQSYLKFDETIRTFGFKDNEEDNCIYVKFRNEKFSFLILHADDILLGSSNVNLLLENKKISSSNFDIRDLCEASYVLGIEIHLDRNKGILRLSQKILRREFK